MDLKKWEVGVPGKEKTIWEGGLFKLEVTFPDGEYRPSSLQSTNQSASSHHSYLPHPFCPSLYLSAFRPYLPANAPTRIPHQAPEMQIHPAALSPQRLPLGHRLPLHPQRRRRLEARHHHQGDPARHPIAARRAEPGVPRPGRRLQPVQEGPPGLREEGEEHCQGESCAVSRHVRMRIRERWKGV